MELQEKGKQRVAIIFGGQSTEHEISLSSSIHVIRAINRQKYDLILIGVDKNGRWMLCDEQKYYNNTDDIATIQLIPTQYYLAIVPGKSGGMQLININNNQPLPLINVAFSVLHGAYGENGSVQGLLEVLNIPYVGSNVLGSAICMDKDITKRLLSAAKIPVTPSITLRHAEDNLYDFKNITNKLGHTVFIKPASQGSSIGVNKVTDQTSFNAALSMAFRYDKKVLVEQEIIGREIEVAVLGNDFPKVSVCGEIITNDKFYTFKTKYIKNNEVKLVIPADLPIPITNNIRQIARRAYLALGCSIMARVDFFLTNQGHIFLNEINTLPGFTSNSMYPKLWKASNLDYPKLVDHLIELALSRSAALHFGKNEKIKT